MSHSSRMRFITSCIVVAAFIGLVAASPQLIISNFACNNANGFEAGVQIVQYELSTVYAKFKYPALLNISSSLVGGTINGGSWDVYTVHTNGTAAPGDPLGNLTVFHLDSYGTKQWNILGAFQLDGTPQFAVVGALPFDVFTESVLFPTLDQSGTNLSIWSLTTTEPVQNTYLGSYVYPQGYKVLPGGMAFDVVGRTLHFFTSEGSGAQFTQTLVSLNISSKAMTTNSIDSVGSILQKPVWGYDEFQPSLPFELFAVQFTPNATTKGVKLCPMVQKHAKKPALPRHLHPTAAVDLCSVEDGATNVEGTRQLVEIKVGKAAVTLLSTPNREGMDLPLLNAEFMNGTYTFIESPNATSASVRMYFPVPGSPPWNSPTLTGECAPLTFMSWTGGEPAILSNLG